MCVPDMAQTNLFFSTFHFFPKLLLVRRWWEEGSKGQAREGTSEAAPGAIKLGSWRGLPNRLGAVTVVYKCN